jgi:ABC-type antimicrobial peptide transport system permease subunit
MIWAYLIRRKERTLLTLLGISIGIAAIVALGAVAEGMRTSYTAMARGSRADLVLTRSADIMHASIKETVANQLQSWPEVADATGVLISRLRAEGSPYFYIFGYDPQGFAVQHFKIVAGQELLEAQNVRGKPCLLGRAAAESLRRDVGDLLHVTGGVFRIVGIYETGDAFEEGGAVISLKDAQTLLLQSHRVSLFFVRLRQPQDESRLRARVERHFDDLVLSTTAQFADRQRHLRNMRSFALAIAALAVIVGAVGMANTIFMSVFERTREIGLLRAVGWRQSQVFCLVLNESLVLSALGGAAGLVLGVLMAVLTRGSPSMMGGLEPVFSRAVFARASVTVVAMGIVGGAFPAWWASHLVPVEALRYEGGSEAQIPRFRSGGLAMRNLSRRPIRTVLTVLGTGMGTATIVAASALAQGFNEAFASIVMGSEAELIAVEADCTTILLSAIDQRLGKRLSVLPEVESLSGVSFAVGRTEEVSRLTVMGYHPREFAIGHFKIAEGQTLTAPRQVIVGRKVAEAMDLRVGHTVRLFGTAFRIVGIYETGGAWEENSVVVSLREAQLLAGKPRRVNMYAIKVTDAAQVNDLRAYLDDNFPEIDVSVTSEFAENLPDIQLAKEMAKQSSFLSVLIGGMGTMNAMLMAVLERTREIGVLRALGWRPRRVMGMILREALTLGTVGGFCGIVLGMALAWGISQAVPEVGRELPPHYSVGLLTQALAVTLLVGTTGAVYPAWRAARMRPVDALRYE